MRCALTHLPRCKRARETTREETKRYIYIINTTSLHSVVFLYNCIENIEENVVDNYIICICIALHRPTQDCTHTNRQIIDIEQG